MGIYADSVEAATKLAIVTGAWIKNANYALGGVGGYYHFHDLLKLIHIWYGNKIKN